MRARGFAAGGRGRPGHQLPVAVQDDALLLNRSPAQVQQYTGPIAQEGAGYVRLNASWSGLAPSPQSTRQPGAPFAASDSSTYPPDSFRRLDTAVNAAAAAGLVNRQGGFCSPPTASPSRRRGRSGLPFWTGVKAAADHPDQAAVVVFGQVRGARGPVTAGGRGR